ncbi:hypothetical protein QYE76_005373 [Lolium multiflorum]|uniref:Uncharacterized protein n=1 Tax=Lolium multiflorum TaxID=4521 RepID=A0AAD8RTS0_LOLMU|nr:hypothetical protein QYE76_005373 [Lolium multiflorum]
MCLTELFSAKRLESYKYFHGEEMCALLGDQHAASPHAVVVKDYPFTLNVNVLTRMVLSKKYIHNEVADGTTLEELKWMVDKWFLLNRVLNVGDSIPWFYWMGMQGYVKRMKKLGKTLHQFLEHVVEEHDGR